MEDNEQQGSILPVLAGIGALALLLVAPSFTRYFKDVVGFPLHHWKEIAFFALLQGMAVVAFMLLVIKWKMSNRPDTVLTYSPDAVRCGRTDEGTEVFIKTAQRSMHTQVIGTTNAGKTESVILPWAIQDLQQGRGLLLIDGKADSSLLNKLWAYTKEANRESDFRLFSLSNLDVSHSFNPLIGGTAEEITERVFNAFEFENPYYRALQYEVMGQVMRMFHETKTIPTFQRLHQAISQSGVLRDLAAKVNDPSLKQWSMDFCALTTTERLTRTSGLLSALSHFAFGETAKLFNSGSGSISLDEALTGNQIVYFQLPVLLSPFMGKATGKLVLQCLQAAIANRHRSGAKPDFFSVFLDDFSEYLYPGFVSILNKSRSANVGIVFAHQALGDIEGLGTPIANAILTNSNLKVFMRGNDPDSAEYFSKVIGTVATTKFTERQKLGWLKTEKSGDVSAREAEEFVIHPNAFKRDLGVGQAIMLVPHPRGTKTIKIKFDIFPDLPSIPMPGISKKPEALLSQSESNDEEIRETSGASISQFTQKQEAA
jgi:hypothetical protein